MSSPLWTGAFRVFDRPLGRGILVVTPALALLLATVGCVEMADHGVVVSSSAMPDYTKTKYNGNLTKRETYVFMQGNYFPGAIVDRSLDTMPFRRVAEMLAPELARRQFMPAKEVKSADLVLVVHWGATSPVEHLDKLLARDPPSLAKYFAEDPNAGGFTTHTVSSDEQPLVSDASVSDMFGGVTGQLAMDAAYQQAENRTDELGADYSRATSMKLLGYGRHLRNTENSPTANATEMMLRSDLESARYFVVVQAYDLKRVVKGRPRLVWTLHLNMSSAGNNFKEAVAMMSEVAVNYFGRDVDHVEMDLPNLRSGQAVIGEITIVGEK